MKDYIESRVLTLSQYIIEQKATVRSTAKKFGISKSTVHTEGVILKLFIWKLPKRRDLWRFYKI